MIDVTETTAEALHASMDRDKLSTLLYIEARAVDHSGSLKSENMNDDDFQTLKEWQDRNLIEFGRIAFKEQGKAGGATHWVRLSPEIRRAASIERDKRQDRLWLKRSWKTADEYQGRE